MRTCVHCMPRLTHSVCTRLSFRKATLDNGVVAVVAVAVAAVVVAAVVAAVVAVVGLFLVRKSLHTRESRRTSRCTCGAALTFLIFRVARMASHKAFSDAENRAPHARGAPRLARVGPGVVVVEVRVEICTVALFVGLRMPTICSVCGVCVTTCGLTRD